MEIYIAGKVTARDRLAPIREQIVSMGHDCYSTWIGRAMDYPCAREHSIAEAKRDLREVQRADLLILDTIDESNTGGREVEMGSALSMETTIWRVGPVRNIFHELAEREFTDWDEILRELKHA